MPPVILLSPDTGPDVGLGHLERCLALADSLRGGSNPVIVAAADGPEAERVRARGHTAWTTDGAWPQRAVAATEALTAALVVLDGYGAPMATQEALRRQAPLVIVDDTNGDCACDLLLNPAPGGDRLAPPREAVRVLAGAAYALLAHAYLEARDERDSGGVEPGSIAVVTGGANLGDLQAGLVAALREALPEATMHIAVGPRATAPTEGAGLVVHQPAPTLAGLLARCALYVGSAGGSAVQAACVGVPAVVIPIAENQVRQAEALADADCAVAVSPGAGLGAVVEQVRSLLGDPARMIQMSAAGRRAVDGRGSERAAEAILELAATPSPS